MNHTLELSDEIIITEDVETYKIIRKGDTAFIRSNIY